MAKKPFDPKAHGKLNEWRVEVAVRGEFTDPVGRGVLGDIADLGIASVRDVRAVSVYLITGAISAAQLQRIASRLLCDPVSEEFSFRGPVPSPRKGRFAVVQVFRKPGVMDPVEASTKKGIADMGFSAASVRTGRKFLLYGKPTQDELRLIATRCCTTRRSRTCSSATCRSRTRRSRRNTASSAARSRSSASATRACSRSARSAS